MSRIQFTRPPEEWSWEKSVRALFGQLVTSVAFLFAVGLNYDSIVLGLAIVFVLTVAAVQVALDRRVMRT